MGFLSTVCSVASAFVSCVSSICSTISGVVGGIGSKIAELASSIIGPNISPSISEIISKIVSFICEIIGLKPENGDSPEELGAKAEQAEKKPDDFESVDEYIKYLQNEIKLDKEKFNSLKDEERSAYEIVGSAIYIKGMEEKYKMEIPADFWHTVTDMNLSADETKAYIDSFKDKNFTSMKDMTDYLKGSPLERGKSAENISDAIMSALKVCNPGLSEDELYDKMQEMMG